ncbi:hypothetical protein [Alteromonas macleodii]|uniref:hypothetical protein n=1 Tax=Alteromonas macleodii TaxID=28108 RepID=UPI0024A85B70|nr:hypothetical protein [Alteromonas macleodii]MEC8963708.1 hypothetical protein [Pseudomonadota bacterium]MEE3026944.1 hypothetical protein [Pseudomonadota bacterium]|tara:strand:+ start:3930 stop:4835 length:906 start_codon:yes stop_codon:yes gene_type:complete
MKFVTKFTVLLAVLMLAAGCVTQRGMDSGESVPSQPKSEEATPTESTEQEDVVQDGDSVNDGTTKGESTKEPVSKPVAPPKQKVGVLVSAKKFPTHTHIGTTKFNNFTKEYSYDWQLNNTLYSTFKKAIEQNSRFTAVDISSMVDDAGALDFVMGEGNNGSFNDKQNTLRKSLLDKGIATVIIVEEAPTVAITECGTYGCSEHQSKGFGLFTRSFLGTDHYIASASFNVSIERLDEPVDILTLPVFTEFQDDALKNERVEDFTPPDNFDEITEQELAPIKNTIVNYFDRLATAVGKYLSGQ